jgi:hypothetical protein
MERGTYLSWLVRVPDDEDALYVAINQVHHTVRAQESVVAVDLP